MLRGKKASRTVKERQVFTITADSEWLLKNFLTRTEKMALVEFYRGKITTILKKDMGEYYSDNGEEFDIKRYGARIKFILDHF